MALPIALGILLPGITIPILTSWMAGEITVGKGRKIPEASLRKIAIGSMAGIGVAALTYVLTRPPAAPAVVTQGPVPKAERPIKLTSGVTVGNYESHPVSQFYSGAYPYPENQHIYVD